MHICPVHHLLSKNCWGINHWNGFLVSGMPSQKKSPPCGFSQDPVSVKLDERLVLVFCVVMLFSGKQNFGSYGAVAGREC